MALATGEVLVAGCEQHHHGVSQRPGDRRVGVVRERLVAIDGAADAVGAPVAGDVDAERKKDWEKERNKDLARKEKNPNAGVRAKWSPKKHGLTALFDANPKFAGKLRIVEADTPHIIDLGESLKAAWPELLAEMSRTSSWSR